MRIQSATAWTTSALLFALTACGGGGAPAPTDLTDLTAVPKADGSVQLAWTASKNATAYSIDRKLTSEADTTYKSVTASVGGITYTDSSVQPSTSYSYKVTPKNGSTLGTPATVTFTTPKAMADVNAYVNSLGTWSAYTDKKGVPATTKAVVTPTPGTSTTTQTVVSGSTEYSCTLTPYNLQATPTEFVSFATGTSLWLGGLVQGGSMIGGIESVKPLTVTERAPITVYTDFVANKTSSIVASPTSSTVKSALNALVLNASNEGVAPTGAIDYRYDTQYSLSQSALSMGLSVAWLGNSVSVDLASSKKTEENTVTAFLIQRAYTASIDKPSTAKSLFNYNFTQDKLDEQIKAGNIGPGNIPLLVSSIDYGRILMFTATSKYSESELKAAIRAAISFGNVGVDAKLTAEEKAVLASSTIKVRALGGSSAGVDKLIMTGKINEYFSSAAKLSDFVPIAYKVVTLDGGLAQFSEKSSYTATSCKQWKPVVLDDKNNTSKTVTINGNSTGVETGVTIQKGDRLQLSSTGTIYFGPSAPTTNANGIDTLGGSDFMFPKYRKFSLIGTLAGETIQLGMNNSFEPTFSGVATSGQLSLYGNDQLGYFGDNTGAWNVNIALWRLQ